MTLSVTKENMSCSVCEKCYYCTDEQLRLDQIDTDDNVHRRRPLTRGGGSPQYTRNEQEACARASDIHPKEKTLFSIKVLKYDIGK